MLTFGFNCIHGIYRYASLYFCFCIDQEDNELEILEIIHHYVETLDRYFGSVCTLFFYFLLMASYVKKLTSLFTLLCFIFNVHLFYNMNY